MANTRSSTIREEVLGWVWRIGALSTLITALVLTSAIIGNLALLIFKAPLTPALRAVVQLGPPIAVFFGNIATGIGYYGTWRIVRGRDEYDVQSGTKGQLQGLPSMLQGAPRALVGCLPLAAASLLVISLITSLLTLAPVRALGVSPADTPRVVITPTPLPPATPTPGRHGALLMSPATIAQRCPTADATLPPVTVTLDNTAGGADVAWRMGDLSALDGAGRTWATPSQANGIAPAGRTATLTLTPDTRLCFYAPAPRGTYLAAIHMDGLGDHAIVDTIASDPRITTSAGGANISQSCVGGVINPFQVTLDNSASNVPVSWSFAAGPIPGSGTPWARAAPSDGAIAPRAARQITVTPDHTVCSIGGTTTYRATVSLSSGGLRYPPLTLTDTITAPDTPTPTPPSAPTPTPPSAPTPTPTPPVVLALAASPMAVTQRCDSAPSISPHDDASGVIPYQVKLTNTGNVPLTWSVTIVPAAGFVNPWAAVSKASGGIPVGGSDTLTLTPNVLECQVPGFSGHTFTATVSFTGGGASGSLTLSDTIKRGDE